MASINDQFPALYSKFLSHHNNEQWYTAHSHHFWPDCTEQAVLDYWHDSAKLVDDKWELIFGEKIPLLKKHLASWLQISDSNQFVFAPNTHELIYRLLTTFKSGKKIKVLTTRSEFHSFSRQIKIYEELGLAEVEYINTEPIADLKNEVEVKLARTTYDLIFISHVFFNSGLVVSNETLDLIYKSTKNLNTLVVIDAYHSFMALPFSMQAYEDHFFYLAGSYKYASAGEGLCFMYIPPKYSLTPIYSGWFADFGGLSNKNGNQIKYDPGAASMAGSTMDYSTLYKLLSIFDTYKRMNITAEDIHSSVLEKQFNFLKALEELPSNSFNKIHNHLKISKILNEKFSSSNEFKQNYFGETLSTQSSVSKRNSLSHGHFFAFEVGSLEACSELHQALRLNKIYTDFRGSRLRFGFGIFQNWKPNLTY